MELSLGMNTYHNFQFELKAGSSSKLFLIERCVMDDTKVNLLFCCYPVKLRPTWSDVTSESNSYHTAALVFNHG